MIFNVGVEIFIPRMEEMSMPYDDKGYLVKWLVLCGEESLVVRQPNGHYELRRKRLVKGKANRERLQREMQQQIGIEKIDISDSFLVWSLYKSAGVWKEGTTWVSRLKGDPIPINPACYGFRWAPTSEIQDAHIYREYGLGDFVYRPNKPKNDENSTSKGNSIEPPAHLWEGSEIVGGEFEEDVLDLEIITEFDPIFLEDVIADDFSWDKYNSPDDCLEKKLEREKQEEPENMLSNRIP